MCLSCRSLIKSSGSSSATSAGECERLGGWWGGWWRWWGGGKKSLSLRGEKKRQRGLVVASFVAAVFAFPWKKNVKKGAEKAAPTGACALLHRREKGGKKRGGKKTKRKQEKRNEPQRVSPERSRTLGQVASSAARPRKEI